MVKNKNLLRLFLVSNFFSLFIITSSSAEQDTLIESLKFKDAEINVVLGAITQKAVKDGKPINVLISPSIKGLVTVDLQNVDWLTALEGVLKTYDYGYEWVGKNIILVDTLENLAAKRQKAQDAQIAEPLNTKVFTLNFAKVEDIKDPLQKLLTPRGKLTYDTRTNTLVITDTQSNLTTMEESIKAFDGITPQVLIEAKIIEVDLDVTDKLGVKWNIAAGASSSSRPHTWPFQTGSNNKYLKIKDFPVPGDSLFSFGTIDPSTLSTTLEFIFRDTDTNIISTPKITTLDNNTATIDVVTEDPIPNYSFNSETGQWEIAGFNWLKYGVSLEVTPQINKESFITLLIKPKVSENVGTRTFVSGGSAQAVEIPILNTQTTNTKVMIKDGETLVLGGLVRDKTIETVNKVPLLGNIPVLGALFRHKDKSVVKKNLLIFITPKIVTPQRKEG